MLVLTFYALFPHVENTSVTASVTTKAHKSS